MMFFASVNARNIKSYNEFAKEYNADKDESEQKRDFIISCYYFR